ncbi:hypothetical protein EDB83DRAFT_1831081 [Lactarius deliciosus]|nr:hypothetical protein EDB83DRAFT_1831081 [Lactarius deliciosus]
MLISFVSELHFSLPLTLLSLYTYPPRSSCPFVAFAPTPCSIPLTYRPFPFTSLYSRLSLLTHRIRLTFLTSNIAPRQSSQSRSSGQLRSLAAVHRTAVLNFPFLLPKSLTSGPVFSSMLPSDLAHVVLALDLRSLSLTLASHRYWPSSTPIPSQMARKLLIDRPHIPAPRPAFKPETHMDLAPYIVLPFLISPFSHRSCLRIRPLIAHSHLPARRTKTFAPTLLSLGYPRPISLTPVEPVSLQTRTDFGSIQNPRASSIFLYCYARHSSSPLDAVRIPRALTPKTAIFGVFSLGPASHGLLPYLSNRTSSLAIDCLLLSLSSLSSPSPLVAMDRRHRSYSPFKILPSPSYTGRASPRLVSPLSIDIPSPSLRPSPLLLWRCQARHTHSRCLGHVGPLS